MSARIDWDDPTAPTGYELALDDYQRPDDLRLKRTPRPLAETVARWRECALRAEGMGS